MLCATPWYVIRLTKNNRRAHFHDAIYYLFSAFQIDFIGYFVVGICLVDFFRYFCVVFVFPRIIIVV